VVGFNETYSLSAFSTYLLGNHDSTVLFAHGRTAKQYVNRDFHTSMFRVKRHHVVRQAMTFQPVKQMHYRTARMSSNNPVLQKNFFCLPVNLYYHYSFTVN